MIKLILVYYITSQQNENLLLTLPLLSVDGLEIKQVTLAKFFGVQIYKNVNWEQQIDLVQCKISKNLGIMFKARKLFKFKSSLN